MENLMDGVDKIRTSRWSLKSPLPVTSSGQAEVVPNPRSLLPSSKFKPLRSTVCTVYFRTNSSLLFDFCQQFYRTPALQKFQTLPYQMISTHLISSFKNLINPMMSTRVSLNHYPPSSSSLPWISPLQYLPKPTSPKPDHPPNPTLSTLQELPTRPKFISHDVAIRMIKREKSPQKALEIFNMVSEQRGFNHNHDTYSTILHKLALSKKFNAVDAVLRQMTFEPCKFHEGLFLNLMAHFSRSSLHEKTLELFYAIPPFVREKPSPKALSTCLNLLLEAGRVDLARRLLSDSKSGLGLRPNTCIFNILVKHHCKSGDFESAFEMVERMKKSEHASPNLITYSTLMGGLCDRGRLSEAIELFEEMVSKAKIFPDALTYNVLINGFCRGGKVDKAKQIMVFMRRNGCYPNIYNYTALMKGFCNEGKLEEAREVFDEMKRYGLEADAVSYTTLIGSLCRVGRVDGAIELLKEMKERGCKADLVTFNVIIGGMCWEKRFDEAMQMVEKLPFDGVYLNKASYRIVMNALCREGEMERAVGLLGLMLGRGFMPHYATSNELLIGLCDAGKAADATEVLYGLSEMRFIPEVASWVRLVESVCRERKLVKVFELLNELVIAD